MSEIWMDIGALKSTSQARTMVIVGKVVGKSGGKSGGKKDK